MKTPVDYKSSEYLFGQDMVLYIMKHHYPKLNFVPPGDCDWGNFLHPLFTLEVKRAATWMFMKSKHTYEDEFNKIFTASGKNVSFATFLYEEGIDYWIKQLPRAKGTASQLPLTPEFFMNTCIRYAVFTAKAYSIGTTTAPSWAAVHLSETIKKLRKFGYITNGFWEGLQPYCTRCVLHASLLFNFNCVVMCSMLFFLYSTQWFEYDICLIFVGFVVLALSARYLFRTITL